MYCSLQRGRVFPSWGEGKLKSIVGGGCAGLRRGEKSEYRNLLGGRGRKFLVFPGEKGSSETPKNERD